MKKKNLVVGKQAQYNYDNISQRAKGFILSGSTNGFKEVYNGQRDHQSAYPGLCGIISWYTTTTRYTPNRDQAATMQEIKKKITGCGCQLIWIHRNGGSHQNWTSQYI